MTIKVKGKVISGNQLGRQIGFPTANIRIPEGIEIKNGVYAGMVCVDGVYYGAMINVGTKPSVGDNEPRLLEAHLFQFNNNLYDKIIEVELIRFIRREEKFSSLNILKNQLETDKIAIQSLLESIEV